MKVTFFSCLFNCDKFIDNYINNLKHLKNFDEHFLIITNVVDSNNEETNNKIKEFTKLDNIRSLNINKNEDPGLYECWNNMIKLSKTELVCNFNPDDNIMPNFLDLVNEFKNNEDLICTPLHIYYNNKDIGYWHHKKSIIITEKNYMDTYDKKLEYYEKIINNHSIPAGRIETKIKNFDIFDMFTFRGNKSLLKNYNYYDASCIPGCCPIWRKELFFKYGGFNEKEYNESADFELWCRYLHNGAKMRCVDYHMVNYSYNFNSLSNNKKDKRIVEKIFKLYHPVNKIFKKYMKVLITGGSGMVGYGIKSIKDNYNYEFNFLSSKDCDLTNYENTYSYFKEYNPDYVIHLAAYVGGLFKNMNYKVDMFEKNLLINFNVLKVCHELKVKKVVSCLSTCIFPDKTTYPINEDMLHNGPPHNSNDAYAYAKRMLEIHSKAYQEQYGDNFVCVIPTNIYGENDNYSLEDGHVIPALIHRCYLCKQKGEKFTVRGTGKPLRQFIYSQDLAKLIMWVLEEYEEKDSIILSVGEKDEVSIEFVARQIAKAFDYEHMIEFDSSFSDGQFKKTADNSKLMKLYGEYKFIDFKDGIKKSVEWFIKNFDNCRK